jgi:hypothetical protein
MNLQSRWNRCHRPRFRLPRSEACTTRGVAIRLWVKRWLKRASEHQVCFTLVSKGSCRVVVRRSPVASNVLSRIGS